MSICCVWVCDRVRVYGAVLWPLLDLVAGFGQHVDRVCSWEGLIIGAQFDVFDFTMSMGQASLRCGLVWIHQMVTGRLWAKIILGNFLIIRATLDCRCWSVGLLIVSWLQGRC